MSVPEADNGNNGDAGSETDNVTELGEYLKRRFYNYDMSNTVYSRLLFIVEHCL